MRRARSIGVEGERYIYIYIYIYIERERERERESIHFCILLYIICMLIAMQNRPIRDKFSQSSMDKILAFQKDTNVEFHVFCIFIVFPPFV